MSPEELDRKLEFIIAHQAEFAIRQDRDHERLDRGFDVLTRLAELQSRRLGRQDKFYRDSLKQTEAFQKRTEEFQNRTEEFQKRSEEFQRQALHLLHMILDRLPPRA